ncbi:MAG: hypothetical protein SPL30_11000 [Succinivibrio sp.]|nr:hypothetical protein [Succinivibrio sp.]
MMMKKYKGCVGMAAYDDEAGSFTAMSRTPVTSLPSMLRQQRILNRPFMNLWMITWPGAGKIA